MKRYYLFYFVVVLVLSSCFSGKHIAQNHGVAVSTHNPTFLFISDIHLNSLSENTSQGNDTGLGLWKIFLNKIDTLLSGSEAPQFIICTGDMPAHYSCSGSCYLEEKDRVTHNANLATAFSQLRDLTTKYHVPFFYLPGNNDALAGDYFSFSDKGNNTPFSLLPEAVNPFPALNIKGGSQTAPCMVSNTHAAMGYYSALAAAGIKLIAMNTVIFTSKFKSVDGTDAEADGAEELEWLKTELQDAATKNEKVYIAMHVPPGLDAYYYKSDTVNAGMWASNIQPQYYWLNRFLTIIANNKKNIAGILYGHTHMDELRRLYDSTGTTITALAISCPAITPLHHNNPGFKLVRYDATTKAMLDFTTYYTSPTAASWGNASYSFNTIFGFNPGKTMFTNLTNTPVANIARNMNKIFTVMNGKVNYDITPGIDVKFGQ